MLRTISKLSKNSKINDSNMFIDYAISNKEKYFLIYYNDNDYLINPWNSKKLLSDYITNNPVVEAKPKPIKKRKTPPQQPS